MITNESNQVDELFRQELRDYTVPVALSTAPLIAVAVKKVFFYKLAAVLKLNTVTLIAGTATITSVATVTTVKIVEHYQKKNAAIHHSHTIIRTKSIESSAQLFADTMRAEGQRAEGQRSGIKNVMPIVDNSVSKNNSTVDIHHKGIVATKNMISKTVSQTTKTNGQTSIQTSNVNTNNQIVNNSTTVEKQKETIAKTPVDTVKKTTAHKVVYVKPMPVIIEDTVVKVIRKARPKKE